MDRQQTTLETNVENIRDAVLRAVGRWVRVSVEYADAKEVREAGQKWLSELLAAYPADPQFAKMTEEEVMAYASEVVDEVRREGKKEK